jgi:Fic family protein
MTPFVPQSLPLSEVRWEALISHLASANRALAYYDGILQGIANPDLLLSPMATQEAVFSSKIEGTMATWGEVLKFAAGEPSPMPEREEDILQILNYRRALKTAEVVLEEKPFTLGLLKRLHAILLDGAPGRKVPLGSFRTIQNWIGPYGTIEKAEFIPPSPEGLLTHLENWEQYYHMEPPDAIVQLAVVHAQFTILHPFHDGNGRLARMLIPLFLFEKKIISRPLFYLSGYFESHHEAYISKLRMIGKTSDAWNEWITFFLIAVQEQARINAEQARDIISLHRDLKARVVELTHSQFAEPMLDLMFETPIFTQSVFKDLPQMPKYPTISTLLGKLKDAGILRVVRPGSGRSPQIWALRELINLCEGSQIV